MTRPATGVWTDMLWRTLTRATVMLVGVVPLFGCDTHGQEARRSPSSVKAESHAQDACRLWHETAKRNSSLSPAEVLSMDVKAAHYAELAADLDPRRWKTFSMDASRFLEASKLGQEISQTQPASHEELTRIDSVTTAAISAKASLHRACGGLGISAL